LKPDHYLPAGGIGQFHTTRWSAVLLSAQSQAPGSKAALAELCTIYWYPLYSYVRRRGSSPEDAQDLTQGFFLHLLDHKALSQVSPAKGKFRSYSHHCRTIFPIKPTVRVVLKEVETLKSFLWIWELPKIAIG
jgi:hypothetical protein